MIRRRVLVGMEIVIVALASALALGACGGSDAPDDDGSGNGNQGGAGNQDGGEGGSAGADSTPQGVPCENYEAPGEMINDFSTWDASDETWGDDMSLTGGSFYWDSVDDGEDMLTATVENEELTLSGDVEGSALFGFWFGPCLDASQFAGISFDISGDFGETEIEFQIQTSRNYPIDRPNEKGECTGTWDDGSCASNKVTLNGEEISGSETVTTVKVPWGEAVGGSPINPADPTELLGILWQFNCASGATCTPNVTIDNVVFYTVDGA